MVQEAKGFMHAYILCTHIHINTYIHYQRGRAGVLRLSDCFALMQRPKRDSYIHTYKHIHTYIHYQRGSGYV